MSIAVPEIRSSPASSAPNKSRTETWITWMAALSLAAFFLASSVYIARHRLFWFDELFIVRIAQLPTIRSMWLALANASDTMPPGYHLLMRVVGRLFGYSELVMRLPSALAMTAGLLITFDCARRLTNGLHGLIAMSVLTCSLLPYYGYEARPYALYFFLSALAFWVWTSTPDQSNWSAFTFAVVLSIAVTMHYYAALCIVPYIVWQALAWRAGQPLPRKLLSGCGAVLITTALLSPLALAFSHQFGSDFWAHPSLFKLRESFAELFPDSLLILAALMIWMVFCRSGDEATLVERMSPAESLG